MARGDGVHRTNVRNANLTAKQIGNVQHHNEREKESYTNQDIVPEMARYNVHYKDPVDSYTDMVAQMESDGIISTRGLRDDAKTYGELIFDVNSAYFHNNGGYDFAKQFYADAYKSAIEIVGGEQFILSAVMHADERNRAMSEALGKDVYHYHLHVVYVPVVKKEILWSKRCKDESLRGTVKETIMQVSSSKKWRSHPAIDESGNPVLQKHGKPVLRKSYSILQDDFYNAMQRAEYNDLERGEHGCSEVHLTVTQFKAQSEQKRLNELKLLVEKKEQTLQKAKQRLKVKKGIAISFHEIDQMGKNTMFGKVEFSKQEMERLKKLAKEGLSSMGTILTLQQNLTDAKRNASIWRDRYASLFAKTKDFISALERAPDKVHDFIHHILHSEIESVGRPKRRYTLLQSRKDYEQ